MRYAPEHKAEIHQKIVKDGARRVRAEGFTGAAVSAVMRDAGLTHGGFYKHFTGKDELLVEALSVAFQEMAERLAQAAGQAPPGTAWKAIVKAYLSPEHCDHAECGCPLAALAPELTRADMAMKAPIRGARAREKTPPSGGTKKKKKSQMPPQTPGRPPAEKERAFFAIFSTMIGAV